MLIKLLKTNKPSSLFALLLLAFNLFVINGLVPFNFQAEQTNNLLHDLLPYLATHHWLSSLILFFLSIVIALSWNRFILDNAILKNSGYVLGFTFLLLSSLFSLSTVWVVNGFLLFSLQILMSIYNKKKPYGKLFNTGFLLGLSCLVYVPSVAFLLTVYAAVFIYSTVSWRTLLIPLIGFITPLFFVYSYAYYFDVTDQLLTHYDVLAGFRSVSIKWTLASSIFTTSIVVFVLLSLVELLKWFSLKNLRARKTYRLLLAYCISCCAALFMSKQPFEHLLLLSIPLSLILANYFFHNKKRWWQESTFILFTLLVLYFKIFLNV